MLCHARFVNIFASELSRSITEAGRPTQTDLNLSTSSELTSKLN